MPVDQAVYAYHNKLIKSLSIYLYLKFFTDGKIKGNSPVFLELRKHLKLTDTRTFKRHLNHLLVNKWIGYSEVSNVYFIRNSKYIRQLHQFKCKQAAIVKPSDLENFQTYLVAVILSKEIKDQEFYWNVAKPRKLEKAPDKWAGAKHSRTSSAMFNKPTYFGLSNARIASHLNCKQTRACVLKNKAAKLGYIEIRHRYSDILDLKKADFNIRAQLYEQFPNSNGKIRCWRKWENGKKFIRLVLQLHDEIIPKVFLKRIKKESIS